METIIAFLASNEAIIGAIVSILEGIVILINLRNKFRSNKEGGVESMSASPSTFKAFLWIANPINVFRKPQ